MFIVPKSPQIQQLGSMCNQSFQATTIHSAADGTAGTIIIRQTHNSGTGSKSRQAKRRGQEKQPHKAGASEGWTLASPHGSTCMRRRAQAAGVPLGDSRTARRHRPQDGRTEARPGGASFRASVGAGDGGLGRMKRIPGEPFGVGQGRRSWCGGGPFVRVNRA